jgi:glyoxylase-like metal-dependent hydrolase (beta-lactamase superfamily II)
MEASAFFPNVSGIQGIFSRQAQWPHSANAFLLPDSKGCSLIDIGCGGDDGIRQFADGLAHWGIEPVQIHTVICSHAHPDHMGALKWLLAHCAPRRWMHHLDMNAATDMSLLENSFDIPLAKRRWRAERGPGEPEEFELLDFFRDCGCRMNEAAGWKAMDDGDELVLGERRLQVIHTPGHSPGHVSFFERKTGTLLAGDIVGKSPAWYVPASGGVIEYLASLDKIDRLSASILLPSHGPVLANPRKAIQTIREKLLRREEILLAALKKKNRRFMELLELLFPPAYLHFFPGIGILESHLQKLQLEGKIETTREGFRFLAD